MARFSLLDGFKDPARRPRFIIWTGVAVLGLAVFMIALLAATSSYWFCANGCHKVQDDTIAAYQASTHSEISCLACHMPVNASPVAFMLHKATALGELYLTVTKKYEIPLNGESHVAIEMASTQCTQCHSTNRAITPSTGIIIDHAIHADNDVSCTMCHNRIAHADQAIEFVNVDPATGEANHAHSDFMSMTACFRCHTQEGGDAPPGACDACHPADFELKPENHFEAGFYAKGGDSHLHAELARAAWGETTATAEASGTAEATAVAKETAVAEETEAAGAEHGAEVPAVEDVFYCGTCHADSFCESCHGIPMPHPAGFADGHGDVGKSKPAICANCHAKGELATSGDLEFCNSCHHAAADPTQPWIPQHFVVVRETGAEPCFECHNPTYCAQCHVRGVQ